MIYGLEKLKSVPMIWQNYMRRCGQHRGQFYRKNMTTTLFRFRDSFTKYTMQLKIKIISWQTVIIAAGMRAFGQFDGCARYLGNNAGGGVGYGPGGVLGSALAARDIGKFTVAIMGDGDFAMNPAALWTAVHYKIPVLIVLHNNNSFGNDEEHQRKLAQERGRPQENAWIGQKMIGPTLDFANLARAHGASAYGPIEQPEEIAQVLQKAVVEVINGGVVLVDIRTELN